MKLLVVDDDRYAREGILSSLPLEEMGILSVMQTQDGKTALEIVRWFCPDIVITDICMPRMDGMAFAGAVRRLQPETQLIFITGFAEIAYLKQAIELSAVAFVEKPLQTGELARAVQHAVDRHQERQSAHRRTESLRKLRRQQAAAMMMRTHKDMDELNELCAEVGFPVRAVYRCLALRGISGSLQEAAEAVETLADASGLTCAVEPREERCLHAVLAGKRNQEDALHNLIQQLLKRLPGAVIGEGHSVNRLEQIHESRKAACLMLERAFYDTQSRYFPPVSPSGAGVLTVDAYAQFVRLMEENFAQLAPWVDQLLADVIRVGCDRMDSVRELMLSMLRALYHRSPGLYGKIYGISNSHELADYVQSVSSAQQYREMLAVLFRELAAMENMTTRLSQVVSDAKVYIAEHIHEPELGLKDIAGRVNFSAAYLNAVFRQETGMTIKQYLIQCRIREAKRLLRNPAVRVSDIAEQCGYSNPNYFAKAFKETTGMTPMEYRERKT